MANFFSLRNSAARSQCWPISGWCYHNDQVTLAQLLHSLPLNEASWMAVQVNRLKYWFFGARIHVELNKTQYKSSSYLEASSCLSLTFLMVPVSSEMSILTLYCRMTDLLLLNASFKKITGQHPSAHHLGELNRLSKMKKKTTFAQQGPSVLKFFVDHENPTLSDLSPLLFSYLQ